MRKFILISVIYLIISNIAIYNIFDDSSPYINNNLYGYYQLNNNFNDQIMISTHIPMEYLNNDTVIASFVFQPFIVDKLNNNYHLEYIGKYEGFKRNYELMTKFNYLFSNGDTIYIDGVYYDIMEKDYIIGSFFHKILHDENFEYPEVYYDID